MIPDCLLQHRQWSLADLVLFECTQLRLVKLRLWYVDVLAIEYRYISAIFVEFMRESRTSSWTAVDKVDLMFGYRKHALEKCGRLMELLSVCLFPKLQTAALLITTTPWVA